MSTPLLQPDDVLTAKEAANLLRVTVKTLERWEKAGKISATRLPGGHRRFSRAEVEALATGRAS